MKKIIKSFVVLIILMALGIGAFFIFQKTSPTEQMPLIEKVGGCGDNICDKFEKANLNVCPSDCASANIEDKELHQCPQYIPPAPSFYENCENKGGSVEAGEKNDKGCQMPPQCILPELGLKTANVTVDYTKELGNFSLFLFGNNTTGSPAVDLGFKFTLSGGVPPMINPKDASDPSNYSFFTEMDKAIETTFNSGLEPMIMFSSPSPQQESDSESFFSQKYFEQFSFYVKKVATHLRDTKWPNNGKIKAVRFSNEPDFKLFFKGTQMDFFRSYETFAKALKSVDPNFIIDAPAFAIRQVDDEKSWIKDFLSYIDKKAYVDIFDVHVYSPSPNDFHNQFKSLKEELAKYPKLSNIYGTPAMGSNEWNFMLDQAWTGKHHEQFDTAWHSSFSIASLINMIEQGVILSVPLNLINPSDQDYGLVDSKGNKKPSYYAFKGFNQLAGANRLSISGTDRMNFAAISGKSDDSIIVVISNYNIEMYMNKYLDKKEQVSGGTVATQGTPFALSDYNAYVVKYGNPKVYDKYTLTLNNLTWSSSDKVTYERYIVDDNKKLELTETKTMQGANTLTFTKDISAPSVEVVKIYKK